MLKYNLLPDARPFVRLVQPPHFPYIFQRYLNNNGVVFDVVDFLLKVPINGFLKLILYTNIKIKDVKILQKNKKIHFSIIDLLK